MRNVEAKCIRFATIAVFGLLAGLLPAYFGAAAAETPEARTACMHDAFRLCSDTIPDVERTKACLMKNRRDLSPLCRGAMPGGGRTHARHRRRHRG